MGKILCIGEALIDMICTDKGKQLSHGENFLKKPGGAPTNVAAAIAALGGSVDLAAKVGVDPFGQHLIDVMYSFGVGTKWMLRDEYNFTTFAFVSLMENGERDFYFNRGADGQLSETELQGIKLTDYSIAHFGSATGFLPGPLQSSYASLFQQCGKENIFTSFDPNYRHLLFQNDTQSFIHQSWKFKEIHISERTRNWGLADSIINGVTEVINKHGKVIVLEDDIITSKGFLKYMNAALDLYEYEDNVMHISGYMFQTSVKLPETFFYDVTNCWGWATWKRAWRLLNSNTIELLSTLEGNGILKSFDKGRGFISQLKDNIDGKINTWAIKWNASVFIHNGLSLHPGKSLVRNIGHDSSGEHCSTDYELLKQEIIAEINVNKIPLIQSKEAIRALRKSLHPSLISRIIKKLKN